MKHFLQESDFDCMERQEIFSMATSYKANRMHHPKPLEGQTWGMLFYKNSTRTRVSFEVGLGEIGAKVVVLDKSSMQIGRGESLADTAQVFSRYLHGLVIRSFGHEIVQDFSRFGSIPVVNALTDFLHPCQIYSDVFTLAEKWSGRGDDLDSLKGRRLVFFGDCCCNMANSWILAASLFGIDLVLCGPESFQPQQDILDLMEAQGLEPRHTFTADAAEAASGADALYTDVWVSMGKEEESRQRIAQMKPYSVTSELMAKAKPEALFLHCMPTHPGLEVTQNVLDSDQAHLYDQAENRLHVQKAILAQLAAKNSTSKISQDA
ncbi:MAG: ornithine carbamoyltransferase [Opitutae bacterium]